MKEHSMDMNNMVHDAERLKELQALPLERKIMITQARIIEFVEKMGGVDKVVVSYSGGKDSTVLLHIARQIYPEIKCVYSDTGLEYPEVRAMAREAGADMVRPKMRFDQVITNYGYPLVSKEVSEAIYYARRIRNANGRERERVDGGKKADRAARRKEMSFAEATRRRCDLIGASTYDTTKSGSRELRDRILRGGDNDGGIAWEDH